GHERMHRDMAREIESSPAAMTALQQRVLDRWRQEFNHVRPHDSLDGKTPAEVYRSSERRFQDPRPATYPPHFVVCRVFRNGATRVNGDSYFISLSLSGHDIGL